MTRVSILSGAGALALAVAAPGVSQAGEAEVSDMVRCMALDAELNGREAVINDWVDGLDTWLNSADGGANAGEARRYDRMQEELNAAIRRFNAIGQRYADDCGAAGALRLTPQEHQMLCGASTVGPCGVFDFD